VTGALPDEPDDPDDPEWPGLVRVVTGALPLPLPEAPAPPAEDPLERVATAPDPAPAPLPPPCDPLAPVRADLPEPRPPGHPCPERGNLPPGSWRMTWIVLRITCVRTSAAGFRAATAVAVVPAEGFSA
jgi:hypothetical protein